MGKIRPLRRKTGARGPTGPDRQREKRENQSSKSTEIAGLGLVAQNVNCLGVP